MTSRCSTASSGASTAPAAGPGGRPPRVVAQQVERDRVQPRLRRAAPPVEALARAQRALERVGQQVLRERPVAGPVREEAEQPLRLGLVEPLEVLVAHRRTSSIRNRLARS
jgi:hypothetical protein